jgi:hypothetical protein
MAYPGDFLSRFPSLRAEFPSLSADNSVKTSCPSAKYNCIAWAANDTEHVWWPDEDGFWPDNAPREVSLEAFIQAYSTIGYVACDDGSLEGGFEKIAIYANAEGPTHAARQLTDGKWTSKLGCNENVSIDISHDSLDVLGGNGYGRVVQFLKRQRTAD